MNPTDHRRTELARLFFREWMKIHDASAWDASAKALAAARLLELLFIEVTKAENIQFTTMFARIAFACHQCQVDKRTQYWIHFFRKKIRSATPPHEAADLATLGSRAVAEAIAAIFQVEIPEDVALAMPPTIPYPYAEVQVQAFHRQLRVVALEDDERNDRLLCRMESETSQLVHVQYGIAERNASFNPTIRQLRSTFGFPVTLSLLDVEVDAAGVLRPRSIVVEPDHLLDVSTVAGCFQGSGAEPVVFLLQKFLPSEQSLPMIVGNIANFFLDELMHNPRASFRATFPKVFRTNPLTFSTLPDATIREIMQTSQRHWVTLQRMVVEGMKKAGIDPRRCYLEPSFYDDAHGLQGRLDVFFKNQEKSAIIELKSGKPFMPNRHGIGASHFIQTLLYDLMVRATFGDGVEPASYILYSGLDSNQLRYAPPVKSEQSEALQVRNQLVAIERLLAGIRGQEVAEAPILQRITLGRFPHLKGYLRKNIERFERAYTGLNDLERRYFNAFAGFIAREHQLAKTGIQGVERANGLASLWLDTFEEKKANFQLLKSLTIKENRASEAAPTIIFDKTAETDPLANFRPGDIAVLYPAGTPAGPNPGAPSPYHDSPISTQIFKVKITDISPQEVTVQLRYPQFNLDIFGEHELWNLEPDQMDMGFTAQYQGLFRWAECEPTQRELLLGIRPPAQPVANGEGPPAKSQLTVEQNSILQKMLAAPEYFLLWGPPGTGKTSQMLRHFAMSIFANTDENLLLLAYTNRAVDEICEALEAIGPEMKDCYLRIGSPQSAGQQFENQLLTNKIAGAETRKELKEILGRHRIFVSTLASFSFNLQLLELKKFRRVVIDEASQILEPSLVGLLPQFEQFILIGDHKQLPAVVVQPPSASAVADEHLHAIGLQNLRNSLFERLYRRCLEQGWNWAYDQLSHQGRMHADIMRFPCEKFYEGKLRILPPELPLSQNQTAPLPSLVLENLPEWAQLVSRERLTFLSTPVDAGAPNRKTNRHEAELLAELVQFFTAPQQPATNHQPPKSIGIITPYRAQIAQIQDVLLACGIDCTDLTIDTVERYQGGARDIILISLCTNAASQMESLVSLSDEGVDRKLNVALTRAREQVVILGNEELLSQNAVYRSLIAHCRKLTEA